MTVQFFDEAEQEQLASDDHEAWRAVCGILLSIVTVGVGIMVLALTVIMW
ncbi:MAG: hypothetical protein GY768_18185 [Planctomycetaceae bacterium]|nr:hypothetical protein [Planctomycetaceae bacterium]